jgi:hypothetical protein
MGVDFLKIIEAFKIKISPTESQKELAQKRLDICSTCEFRRGEIDSNLTSCGQCGCFIYGKIFTNEYDACPEGKWSEIDKPHFKTKEIKTLI